MEYIRRKQVGNGFCAARDSMADGIGDWRMRWETQDMKERIRQNVNWKNRRSKTYEKESKIFLLYIYVLRYFSNKCYRNVTTIPIYYYIDTIIKNWDIFIACEIFLNSLIIMSINNLADFTEVSPCDAGETQTRAIFFLNLPAAGLKYFFTVRQRRLAQLLNPTIFPSSVKIPGNLLLANDGWMMRLRAPRRATPAIHALRSKFRSYLSVD